MLLARSRFVGLLLLAATACNNPAPIATSNNAEPAAVKQEVAGARAAEAGAPAIQAETSKSEAQAPAATTSGTTHEFRTEPVPEGYQRFEPPAVELDPGDSHDWAQWVGGPLDKDYDVIDIRGQQSIGGHHALVYATTVAEMPGTTRLWKEEDQITSRLMGGIGGEGGANVQFPAGVVFRVKKGSYILIQTHFLNATPEHIVGRTVIDLKLAPVDASRTVASMFSSTSVSVTLAAHTDSAMDITCAVEKDLKFLQVSNHMHDYGKTQLTEYVDPSGAVHVIKDDRTWASEQALNPNFTKYTLDSPLIVPKGSMVRTHCTWNNTTASPVTFPTEMCVFFGFILNENDIYCTDGEWSESKSFDMQTTAKPTETAPTTPDKMQPEGLPGTAAESGKPATTEAVGCTSMSDQAIMDSAEFDRQSTACATPCGLDPDVASCSAPCFEKDVGLSKACAVCNATNVACGAKSCLTQCLTDSASPACRSCVMTNCDPAFRMCTGT
ncbi:MAG TPA: hypothetical protein VFN67_24935 [Polyangiales bacterium]|nr:hypothetical protein [Polyangiales bacterium]